MGYFHRAALVEQLIQSSPAMGEQIRQSLAVMGILATDADPISPPATHRSLIFKWSWLINESNKPLYKAFSRLTGDRETILGDRMN
ncbi:MAG: hypothetical protein QNJ41_26785 [Xenococcaceae cyanobacterium MO_188.B32]|nr:hypothetical protein [Xenococcaceae cyanobacterium MO_188.B32]